MTKPDDWVFEGFHVLPDTPVMQNEFLSIVATLASQATHPFAPSVLRIAALNAQYPRPCLGFEQFALDGLGALITLSEEARPRAIVLGSRSVVAQCGFSTPPILEVIARRWESQDGSTVWCLGWDAYIRAILRFNVASLADHSNLGIPI